MAGETICQSELVTHSRAGVTPGTGVGVWNLKSKKTVMLCYVMFSFLFFSLETYHNQNGRKVVQFYLIKRFLKNVS